MKTQNIILRFLIAIQLMSVLAIPAAETTVFPVRARATFTGNMEVPGYFCDGLSANGQTRLPFNYDFTFSGSTASGTLIGCCGVNFYNSSPYITNYVSAGSVMNLLRLTVSGEFCVANLSLYDLPSCFDAVTVQIPNSWTDSTRPSSVQWVTQIRRNTNSTPIANWNIIDKTGKALPPQSSKYGYYTVCADGISLASAHPNNTSEALTYEFIGDPLDSQLSSEGVFRAGRKTGTVQIHAISTNTDVCIQKDFYFNLVDCGKSDCDSCQVDQCAFGTAKPHVNSLDVQLNLGAAREGSSNPYLQIKEDAPSTALGTPELLQCNFIRSDMEVTTNSYGWLRQLRVLEGYVDVVTNSETSYNVDFYRLSDATGYTNGLYEFGNDPFKSVTLELVGGDTNHFRMTEDSGSTVSDYYWETNGWALVTGGGLRRETLLISESGDLRTEARTIKNGSGVIERENTETWQTNIFGDRLVMEVFGSGASARTNTYTYSTNGFLQQAIFWDGSWDIYEQDEYGRQTAHYSPFLNSAASTNASLTRLVTSTYTNSVVSGSGDDGSVEPYSPRLVTEYVQGTEVSRHYAVYKEGEHWTIACPNPGADWDDTNNLVTKTYTLSDSLNWGKPWKILNPDGTVQLFTYTRAPLPDASSPDYDKTTIWTGSPNASTNGIVKGTIVEIWQDDAQRTLASQTTDAESQIWLKQDFYFYDEDGHLTNVDHLDGTTDQRTFDCCVVESSTDSTGTTTSFTYDALKRQLSATRDGITLSNVLNSAGDVLATYRIGTNGNTIQISGSSYDTTGRLLSVTNALDETTTFDLSVDSSGQKISTTTFPTTGTRVETQARDGTLLVLDGTSVYPVRYTNGVATIGGVDRFYTDQVKLLTNGTDSAETVRSVQDGLGRLIESEYPNSATNRVVYNSLGQMTAAVDPDGVTTLYAYDDLSRVEYQAVDVNGNGSIDLSGSDRVTRTDRDVLNSSTYGTDVVRVRTYGYATDSSDTETLLSESAVSWDGFRTWTTANGLTSSTLTELLGSGLVRTTRTAPDGTMTIGEAQSGRPLYQTVTNASLGTLRSETYCYDAHNRRSTVTDARTGTTTFTFDDLDRVATVSTPVPATGESAQVTTYAYDSGGLVQRVESPDSLWTTNQLYLTGQPHLITGARTYPVEYTYDYAGRVETLKTWQDYAGNSGTAVTTWKYDGQRGFLTNKLDNASQGPAYTYTKGGRLETRSWARGVTTTYDYTGAGDLDSIDYSDSTPDVAFGYDRQGRANHITGAVTNDLVFNAFGQLLSETAVNRSWNYTSQNGFGYDAYQRRSALTNYSLGLVDSYAYDAASRLQSVSTVNGGVTTLAGYSYLTNSLLIESVTMQQGGSTRLLSTRGYDNLNRLRQIISTNGTLASPLSATYGYNSANQRVAVTNADNSFWSYGYDHLGQLTNGWRYWSGGSNVLGQAFNYTFDDIGNRTATQTGGDDTGGTLRSASYYPNLLNQLTNRTVPGYVEVGGVVESGAEVTVNGSAAQRQDDTFRREVAVTNGSTAVVQWLNTVATNTSGTSVVARLSYVPQTPEAFTHDADGNLTQDGLWAYTWDAENRLTRIETRTNAVTDTAFWKRIDCDYDYAGRRVRVRVRTSSWDTSGGAFHQTGSKRFFYDGWNLIGQVDEVTGVRLSFLWGLDLSGTMQGAGGVGGLTAMIVHNGDQAGTYFYGYDGNGNVTALVNASDGSESARYEYGPFGEPLRVSGGALAELNRFRFSTKLTDEFTGLSYYGYRYYSASTGRWLNSDPLGEAGGLNLYGFVSGDPINGIDPDGRFLLSTYYHYLGNTYAGYANSTSNPYLAGAFDLTSSAFHGVGNILDPLTLVNSLAELNQATTEMFKRDYNVCRDNFWGASYTAGAYGLGKFFGIGGLAEAWYGVDIYSGQNLSTVDRWSRGLTGFGGTLLFLTPAVNQFEIANAPINLGSRTAQTWEDFQQVARAIQDQTYAENGWESLAYNMASNVARRLESSAIVKGMELNPSEYQVFRGGSNFTLKPGEFRLDPTTGLVKPTHGISLDVNASTIERFGGAFQIKSVPPELRIIQRGNRLEHFEVVPRQPMPPEQFQELLNQIEVH